MDPLTTYITIKGIIGLGAMLTSVSVGGFVGLHTGVFLMEKIDNIKTKHNGVSSEITVTSHK